MKTYSYFPGCSLERMALSYHVSTLETARRLDVELKELEDWNCCGATAYFHVDELLAYTLCARNLAMAEREGHDLIAPCSGCFKNMYFTNAHLKKEPDLAEHINAALEADGLTFSGTIEVRHLINVFVEDVGLPEIKKRVTKPLAGLRVEEVLARLQLKPGQVVADLGAGTGVFSVPMGRAVSPGGTVYAVEVDAGYFDIIRQKAAEAGASNVRTVLGEFGDPKLPTRDIDVAFFSDVLHHIEDRAGYLKNLAAYVKPSGRVAIIDLKAEQSPHRDQPELVVSEAQVTAWMKAAGFGRVEQVDMFSDKFFLIYSRASP